MYGTKKVLPEPSREAKTSGVHKDNCAAGISAFVLVRAHLQRCLKKVGPKRDPREPARAPKFAKINNKVK